VVVKGHAREGPWEESTSTNDVCYGGLSLGLSRRLAMGHVVQVALPLPEMFRRFDIKSPQYRVFALVRHADAPGPPFRTGLMFFGRHPPRGYEDNPSGLFFLPDDPQPGGGDRTQPRHPLLLTVRLRRLDEGRGGPPEEITITEDVSLGGASVRTTMPVARGELVSLAEADGPFKVSAVVHNVTRGPDKITRLNLQFTNEAEAAAAVKDLLRRQGIN
jgi:hypothetical protein